jgi:hypothetical protein
MVDPDLITGFNIERFDNVYLLKRAEQQLVIEEPDEDDIYSPNVFGVINSVHDEAQKRIENRGEDEEKQKELLN